MWMGGSTAVPRKKQKPRDDPETARTRVLHPTRKRRSGDGRRGGSVRRCEHQSSPGNSTSGKHGLDDRKL